jgi:alpha-galactosidase
MPRRILIYLGVLSPPDHESTGNTTMRTRTAAVLALTHLLATGVALGQATTPFVGPRYTFTLDQFTIEGELTPFEVSRDLREVAPYLYELTVRLHADAPAEPPQFSVSWDVPSVDIAGFWNTNISVDKVSYYRTSVESRASRGAPVIAFYNSADINRLTVAVSDALNLVRMRASLQEEDSRFYHRVTFFSERTPATADYQVTIRIDARSIPYYRSLAGVSEWWAALPNYAPTHVPDGAKWPMYSTWYSFHQNLDPDAVLAELEIAKSLGYEAVIVDDGWQTLDSQRGYRFTGDWQPVRIPDMAGFVQRVHDLGMKFLLWYSVPFIGEEADNYQRFVGRYLRYWESQGAYVLDPRYPEVREFIINTYVTAMDRWNLDGFKLDFMAFFAANDSTVLEATDGRDYASVNQAMDRLMTDIMQRLRAENPEVLVEFRQPYIGPLMRRYGNMFRGVDAPNNAVANRFEVTDVRLLAGNTAVHSDMFIWHNDEPVEAAAMQMLNILFSVPQLSVRLTEVPEDHLRMVGFWTRFWRTHRETLLDGEFVPVNPGAAYPVIKAYRDGTAVVGVYGDMVVSLDHDRYREIHLVNGKATRTIVVDLATPLEAEIEIFDTEGNLVSSERRNLSAGLHQFTVPAAGLVSIVDRG